MQQILPEEVGTIVQRARHAHALRYCVCVCVCVCVCDSICIVRECRELKASFGTQFTDQLLSDADNVSVREIKNHLLENDKEKMLVTCDTKAPLL